MTFRICVRSDRQYANAKGHFIFSLRPPLCRWLTVQNLDSRRAQGGVWLRSVCSGGADRKIRIVNKKPREAQTEPKLQTANCKLQPLQLPRATVHCRMAPPDALALAQVETRISAQLQLSFANSKFHGINVLFTSHSDILPVHSVTRTKILIGAAFLVYLWKRNQRCLNPRILILWQCTTHVFHHADEVA